MTTPHRALRILITNNTASARAGSELYVRDLALALLRRGHHPVVYSTVLGEVADLLRQATVPVVDDLEALAVEPDLIHGQHHLETMTALLRFPHVPSVYFCHGWLPWEELPPVFPSIRRYVAVDDLCAERLLTTPGIAPERVSTLYNGVELTRFRPRGALPTVPGSALIFSNYAEASGYSTAIRDACHRHGIARVHIVGLNSGHAAQAPETLLGEYDLVFAKARCALEAMAVGCATVIADRPGLGGMVTTANLAGLRRLNFGVRTMQWAAVTEEAVSVALAKYDPVDAAAVSAWVRREAGFDTLVDQVVALYGDALTDQGDDSDVARAKAAAGYLRSLSPILKSLHQAENRAAHAADEHAGLQAQLTARAEVEVLARQSLAVAMDENVDLLAQRDDALAAGAALREQILASSVTQETARAALAATQHECIELRQSLEDLQSQSQATSARYNEAVEALAATRNQCNDLRLQLEDVQDRMLATSAQCDETRHALAASQHESIELGQRLEDLQSRMLVTSGQHDEARHALAEIRRSRAWRAVTAYRRMRARLS